MQSSRYLPLGKYYVKEKETAEGYVLDGEIREIDLTYADQDTAEVNPGLETGRITARKWKSLF